jgi:hypothetical protein
MSLGNNFSVVDHDTMSPAPAHSIHGALFKARHTRRVAQLHLDFNLLLMLPLNF